MHLRLQEQLTTPPVRAKELTVKVEIEYCVPCGHLDRAINTQRELLSTFGRDLEQVALTTGQGGVFKVRVDGEMVLDARRDGYDLDRIRGAVEQRLAA